MILPIKYEQTWYFLLEVFINTTNKSYAPRNETSSTILILNKNIPTHLYKPLYKPQGGNIQAFMD